MFAKVNVPVLGLVETRVISAKRQAPTFSDTAAARGEARSKPLLGQSIDIATRESGDQGAPIVTADPRSPVADAFPEIARQIAAGLAGYERSAVLLLA
jgi:ATP-binding protein involved in chromosome partitioning